MILTMKEINEITKELSDMGKDVSVLHMEFVDDNMESAFTGQLDSGLSAIAMQINAFGAALNISREELIKRIIKLGEQYEEKEKNNTASVRMKYYDKV